jgi:hypothetical protein
MPLLIQEPFWHVLPEGQIGALTQLRPRNSTTSCAVPGVNETTAV